MTVNDLLANALQTSWNMLTATIGELSDADLLTRPVPGANHANWQLGHLFNAEARMLAAAGGSISVPEDFPARYTKHTAASDDPAAFFNKEQLLAIGQAARNAMIAWAKAATPEQLDAPAPETMRRLAGTIADLIALQVGHTGMHTGQIQVLRRKLAKPVLF